MRGNDLAASMRERMRAMRRKMRAAQGSREDQTVNVSVRSNIRSAIHVGTPDSATVATSSQQSSIRQDSSNEPARQKGGTSSGT